MYGAFMPKKNCKTIRRARPRKYTLVASAVTLYAIGSSRRRSAGLLLEDFRFLDLALTPEVDAQFLETCAFPHPWRQTGVTPDKVGRAQPLRGKLRWFRGVGLYWPGLHHRDAGATAPGLPDRAVTQKVMPVTSFYGLIGFDHHAVAATASSTDSVHRQQQKRLYGVDYYAQASALALAAGNCVRMHAAACLRRKRTSASGPVRYGRRSQLFASAIFSGEGRCSTLARGRGALPELPPGASALEAPAEGSWPLARGGSRRLKLNRSQACRKVSPRAPRKRAEGG